MNTGLCGNEFLKWQKTLLLETAANCTSSGLSSKFVRSRYQFYSPFNDTEDVNLLNKFVDEEPGEASGGWWRLLTPYLLYAHSLVTCYRQIVCQEDGGGARRRQGRGVGSTKPTTYRSPLTTTCWLRLVATF